MWFNKIHDFCIHFYFSSGQKMKFLVLLFLIGVSTKVAEACSGGDKDMPVEYGTNLEESK